MKTYDPAPQHVQDRVDALLKRYYADGIGKVGLSLDLVYASSEDPEKPAVTLGGYPCLAVVKILGPKDRAKSNGDAEIVIDRDKYEAMSDEERDALLDHELFHLELKTDEFGQPDFDDHQRPKLKMRKHDHQFGWFDTIARRHKAQSIEVQQAREFMEISGQFYFDLAPSPAPSPEAEVAA